MSPSNESKDEQAIEPDRQGFKQISFEVLHCLFRANETVHNFFYYVLLLIEALQMFYYVSHPLYPYYQNSTVIATIHQFLLYLVPNEQMINNSNLYQVALPLAAIFIIIEIFLFLSIMKEIKRDLVVSTVKRSHTVLNMMFLIFNTVLTIPFLGFSVNVLYCNKSTNPYNQGQSCYQGVHIGYCFLAAFVVLAQIFQMLIHVFIYYNKNPFAADFLAKYQNNAALGKFILKLLPIAYLAVDGSLNFVMIYSFGYAGAYGGYYFFFRMFAFHDYNQWNFYYAIFYQVFLAWFSVNNIILYFLDTQKQAGGIFQSVLCGIIIGALMIQIQLESYSRIFLESLQSDKVKKQNIQKFIYRLIYIFIHCNSEADKNYLSTVIQIMSSKNKVDNNVNQTKQMEEIKTIEKRFYNFLGQFLDKNFGSHSNVMLSAINCYALIFHSQYSFAFHRSLELSNKKISLNEELMMYRFRRNTRFDKQKLDPTKRQSSNIFMMYYDFNQNLMKIQDSITKCAQNNFQYWQEVCEVNPSIYKIRNLAQKYQKMEQSIDASYNKIYEIFPNNKSALRLYIDFLMYIGVNVKSLNKAKFRYQQAQENIKKTKQTEQNAGILTNMGENETLAYMTLQTSQNGIGVIKNCNSELKGILGYEKNQLIDKKVHKIMPKSYTQFHDDLLRNFIRKKQHNQKNKVERIIYALNKQSLLVEVVLFTKVNYQTVGEKSGLELIGFLKKIQNPKKCSLILEMNSNNIIGINGGFSKLIENGILPTDFSNNSIKIQTLLPNIDLQGLCNQKSQQTRLMFSSSTVTTGQGLNLQINKKVMVSCQWSRQFSTKQNIFYLNVQKVNGEMTAKALVKQKSSNQVFSAKNIKKNAISMVSICDQMGSQDQDQEQSLATGLISHPSKTSQSKEQENSQMIDIKKDEFLKNQHLDIFRYVLWVMLFLLVSVTIGIYIENVSLNFSMINTSRQINGQIKDSYIITYKIGEINKLIQKISEGTAYSQDEFKNNSLNLNSSVLQFEKSLISLMTLAGKYPYPLQLNQFRYYDIAISKNINSTQIAKQTIIDAYFQYISQSRDYAGYTYDAINDSLNQWRNTNSIIQKNAMRLFPTTSRNMALEYLNLDGYMYDQNSGIQFIVSIVYAAVFIAILAIVTGLINKINAFNQNVVTIYNQIKLWDATEMKNKCTIFIAKNGSKIISKNNIGSILEIFPQDCLLKVIQKPQDKFLIDGNSNINQSFQNQKLLKNEQTVEDTTTKQQTKSQYQTAKQRKFNVHVSEKNKLKTKFITLGIVCLVFVIIFFIKIVKSGADRNQILQKSREISDLGKVRDNLSLMNYYTYQIMLNSNSNTFRKLLQQQISDFYLNTKSCYSLIGDPSMILKQSYNLVQDVTALIFSNTLSIPDSERYSIRNAKYLLQQKMFNDSIYLLTQMIDMDLTNKSNSIFSNILIFDLVFSIAYSIMIIVLAFVIKVWMLEEILRNSKKSKSMVQMLPPWLIQRNKGIFDMFAQKN